MTGHIDIVCNVYTPEVLQRYRADQSTHFKDQIRMQLEMRGESQ